MTVAHVVLSLGFFILFYFFSVALKRDFSGRWLERLTGYIRLLEVEMLCYQQAAFSPAPRCLCSFIGEGISSCSAWNKEMGRDVAPSAGFNLTVRSGSMHHIYIYFFVPFTSVFTLSFWWLLEESLSFSLSRPQEGPERQRTTPRLVLVCY